MEKFKLELISIIVVKVSVAVELVWLK